MNNNKENRPNYDDIFMATAQVVSLRSTCRRQVGAIICQESYIISEGYNGAPKGLAHCSDLNGCMRQLNEVASGTRQEFCRAVHAEQNAIIQAAVQGIKIKGGTLYVTTYPCSICTRMIINAEISRVVYDGEYSDPLSKEFFKEAGIPVEKYRPKVLIKVTRETK